MFEFRGIICRHALVVLAQERQKSIPTKYILQRWSKNVRRKHNYIVTSFNSKDKPPHIQRYDALCERFREIAEIACENHETSELLFAHLQSFAHTHDMSHSTKAYNKKTHYPAKSNLGNRTPQRNNSINDRVNTNIHSPEPVSRKGRPPYKRLKSASEMSQSRKKAVPAKRTSSGNNFSEPVPTTVSTMNNETETVRVTFKFTHLHESGVVFRVILC